MDHFGKYSLPNVPFAANYFGKDGYWIGDPESADDAPENDRSMPTEFTKANCVPASMGGKPITRHMMNKLGYLATIGSFLDRIGYPYGNVPLDWNHLPSKENVGGYPKGAIITIYDEEKKVTRQFQSLVDNNVNTDPWDYATGTLGEANADADTMTFWTSRGYWKPLFRLNEYNYFPDYSTKIEIFNESVYTTTKFNLTVENPGWLYVRRYIPDWDSISKDKFIVNPTSMSVDITPVTGTVGATVGTTIMPYEGVEATRLLPYGACTLEIIIRNSLGVVSQDNTQSAGTVNVTIYQLGFESSDTQP